MKPLLIDSHTHLDQECFHEDLEDVIGRAHEAGVTRLLTIGAGGGADEQFPNGLGSAHRAVRLAERFPSIYAAVGIHPHDAGGAAADPEYIRTLRELARHPKVVAIGEIGLDYFRDWSPFEAQRIVFRQQIALALEVEKPIIIHSRNTSGLNDAGQECLAALSEAGADRVGGVFHCFSESADFARTLATMNFRVSFPGSLTFRKAGPLRDIAREIPLEQILVETDAPYMAPEPHRGKRCESMFVTEVALVLSEIKGISYEECCRVVTQNTVKLFTPMQEKRND
jgi:TatD DNase family protein